MQPGLTHREAAVQHGAVVQPAGPAAPRALVTPSWRPFDVVNARARDEITGAIVGEHWSCTGAVAVAQLR